MQRVRQRDYFAVHLGPKNDRRRFIVTEVLEDGLKGFWFLGSGSQREERTIPNDQLGDYEVLITHYFAEMEINYTSAVEFLLRRLVRYEWIPLYRERLLQYLFNRRPLDEKRRIQVLRLMLDGRINGNPPRSAIDIMTELYGNRWAHHPQQSELHEYYEMMLDSFVASGDATLEEHFYELAPQAMNTIHTFNEEERRHNGNVAIQRWMLIVTAMVGVATFIQAWTAVFPSAKP